MLDRGETPPSPTRLRLTQRRRGKPATANGCAQRLQNQASAPCSRSIIRSSSLPHFGHRSTRHCRAEAGPAKAGGEGGAGDPLPHLRPQPVDVAQADADGAVVLDHAVPLRRLHVDRPEAHAVALRVLDQRRRVVEPHRLVVEERGIERAREVGLQIGAGVDDQREAGGVRLGEAVERERRDGQDDRVGGGAGDAVAGHALAQAAPRSPSCAPRSA